MEFVEKNGFIFGATAFSLMIFSITTLSIMTLSIMTLNKDLIVTLRNNSRHKH
jgi:hypothetical protein